MLTVDEAIRQISQAAAPLEWMDVPIDQALGHVLAHDVESDIDSPPYDKSMVDGYAVLAADLAEGQACELPVIEEVTAGMTPQRTLRSGTTTRIMTGRRPVPTGADAVVMVEETEIVASALSEVVRINAGAVPSGSNILPQGVVMHRGDVVVSRGTRLGANHLAVLAEVGRDFVQVCRIPSVAVLATGDELVPVGHVPGPGQIRNSNGPMLVAMARSLGCAVRDLGIVGDNEETLATKIAQGLEYDVLVLSGGVSAGVLDLVPKMLADAGVEQVFHKVSLKPGKPLWFGKRQANHPALVFGLPGNPVSSFVCFHLFVQAAVRILSGAKAQAIPFLQAELTAEHQHRGGRPTFHPGRVTVDGGRLTAAPVRWLGSADLRGLAEANALIFTPAKDQVYPVGSQVQVIAVDQGWV